MKHLLQINEEAATSGAVGIVTSLPAYRLCHFLQQELDEAFQRQKAHQPQGEKGPSFGHFIAKAKNGRAGFHLLEARTSRTPLLPDFPRLDYLLLAKDLQKQEFLLSLRERLQMIPAVDATFVLDLSKTKHKANLDFD